MDRRDFIKLSGAALLGAASGCSIIDTIKEDRVGGLIPVLMYHDISGLGDEYSIQPEMFSRHMEWLYRNEYQTFFLNELRDLNSSQKEKAVIITFDDGYASFIDYALPLFIKYDFKATINIIGNRVGKNIYFVKNRPALKWQDYNHLLESGHVDLGCHTYGLHTKGGVSKFSQETLKQDFLKFQETLQNNVGRTAEVLAWPYGIYNIDAVETAIGTGFKYLLTSNEGYLWTRSSFLEIPRFNISDRTDTDRFPKLIQGT